VAEDLGVVWVGWSVMHDSKMSGIQQAAHRGIQFVLRASCNNVDALILGIAASVSVPRPANKRSVAASLSGLADSHKQAFEARPRIAMQTMALLQRLRRAASVEGADGAGACALR
jgi:hypothetical protein